MKRAEAVCSAKGSGNSAVGHWFRTEERGVVLFTRCKARYARDN